MFSSKKEKAAAITTIIMLIAVAIIQLFLVSPLIVLKLTVISVFSTIIWLVIYYSVVKFL